MKHERFLLSLLCFGTCAMYGLLSVLHHRHFGTYAYDLGIFDQAIWNVGRLHAPTSDIRGLHNLLGDHFHPIIFLLSPLVVVFKSVEVLLWAQATLIALSVPAVYLAAKQQLRAWPALGIASAYALFWGIQQMVFFDFHEIAFAVPLIAWALFALQKQFWALYALCCLGLLFTKEDVSLLVAAFGILLIARRQWWPGVTSVLVGLTWFEVVTRILIPHFAGGQYAHWTYNQFGPDAVSAASKAITHPVFTIHELFSPRTKLKTVWYLFHPWLLLPFLSPLTWLTVPLIAARFFGQVPAWWTTGFHYNASIAPILAVAAADGLRRLSGCFPKRMAVVQNGGALAIVTVAVVTIHFFPLSNLFHLKYYQLSQSERTGMQAVQLIPAKAPVTAQESIISHLSERDRIETLDHGASGLAYLITSENTGTYPLPDSTVVKQVLQETLAKHHYERIFNQGGWMVYRIVN